MKLVACMLLAIVLLGGCLPVYQQHEIASIRAVGVTGAVPAGDDAYRQIESTLDGLSVIFRDRGFTSPIETWLHQHGKRYDYGYYLTGERLYSDGYVYSGVHDTIAQCTVEIDRKTASLRFIESEWPRKSGVFPMAERQRQHMRDTARLVGDYLRKRLPSHDVQVSIDFRPPHVTKA